ncbi:MAG: DUF1127 domain-containing protein [Alphaproteobacteria bacterium]|nr:DUF1127 domain-containing protein [Alphaproteobacteria bacterium]MBV8410533.1 DUF1127 domain-containing protein [Alphaproteobacteria bacterium]
MSYQSRHRIEPQPSFETLARRPASGRASLRERWVAKLIVWRGRIVARRHLAEMDARSLRDAGISPAAAAFECGKPFWRPLGPLR